MRFERQLGTNKHFAEIRFEMGPTQNGREGLEFIRDVQEGNLPEAVIPFIQQGFEMAMHNGPIGSYPMANLRVRLLGGQYISSESSPLDFEVAAQLGFREAAPKASPALLEPIMELEIQVPDSYTGAVVSDINRRHGLILGMDNKDHYQIVKAEVPLRNLFGYVGDLRTMCAGRGIMTMRFTRYDLAIL